MSTVDLEAAWRRCVAGHGYDVAPIPRSRWVTGHVHALVPVRERPSWPDTGRAAVPVLGLAAAATSEDALRDLAEASVACRLRARGVDATGVGAGRCRDEAVVRAVYRLLERDALGRLAATPAAPVRSLRPGPDSDATGEPLAAHGTLHVGLLAGAGAVPTVTAVLRLAGSPGQVRAVACDLVPWRAARAAVRLLLAKLAALGLLHARRTLAEHARSVAWVRLAVTGAGDPGEPAGAPLPAVGDEPCVTACPGPVAPAEHLAALRGALRAAGLRATVRELHLDTRGEATGVALVQARVDGLAAAGAAPAASVWAPPDPAAVDLALPDQSALTCSDSHVRLSRTYHENSKIRTLYRDQPEFRAADVPAAVRRVLGRAVRDTGEGRVEYALPAGGVAGTASVEDAVRGRRSWAAIGADPLTLAELGHLLRFSYGVTGTARVGSGEVRMPLRAVPSAGGLYSNDLYLVLDRVEGIPPGVYYYHPLRHRLRLVRADRSLTDVAAWTGYPDRVREAAAVAVYVGCLRRLQWKYWERGYRMSLLDCGHLAGNVVLLANALGWVAHPMIAFVDDYFNELVGVDGVEDVVLYLTLLGRAAGRPVAGTGS